MVEVPEASFGIGASVEDSAPAIRYRTLFRIGRGGMGVVEVAVQFGPGERLRIVALKRLLPEASRERRVRDMFLREARVAGMLEHPNVVRALDCGQIGGEVFIAMEFVEGETLSSLFEVLKEKGHRVAPAVTAHILALVCDALHAAHELSDPNGVKLNLVHRDVSPHNVMIARDGEVKLLDFGVAKIDASEVLTRTGEVKGKAAYMSPEQVMSDPLDRRSDLYSVGALLFECIAGRKMWEGTEMEIIRDLTQGSPPRLEDWAPDAPPELCQLHARLVARRPEDRPPTAQAVAAELRAYVAKSGVTPDQWMLEQSLFGLFAAEAHRRREALRSAISGSDLPERQKERLMEQIMFRQSGVHGRSNRPPPPASVPPPPGSVSEDRISVPPSTRAPQIQHKMPQITVPTPIAPHHLPPPPPPPSPEAIIPRELIKTSPGARQIAQVQNLQNAQMQTAPQSGGALNVLRRYALPVIALALTVVVIYCLSMLYLRK